MIFNDLWWLMFPVGLDWALENVWTNTEVWRWSIFVFPSWVTDDVGSDLAGFICSVLPNSSANELVSEALQTLGVETLEDLKYVQEADLDNVLMLVEARKLIAHVKALYKYTYLWVVKTLSPIRVKIKTLPPKIFERFSNSKKLKASLMFWHWNEIDILKGRLRISSRK